jgi:hypothetical protein
MQRIASDNVGCPTKLGNTTVPVTNREENPNLRPDLKGAEFSPRLIHVCSNPSRQCTRRVQVSRRSVS